MKRTLQNKLMVAAMATLFMVGVAIAQAPQFIPFQAVARDSKGVVMANKTLALRFSVLDGPNNSATLDAIVYQETQTQTTNAIGLFMANIGQGTVLSGSFGSINWGTYNKFIQVDMDITGTGVQYTTIATQQLMSVPYALYANNATNADSANNGVPPGTVVAFMGNIPPAGWLLCDFSAVSRKTYAKLFAVIGTSGGIGNGSTTFNLPELRGDFLRGRDGGTGADPDAANRVAEYTNTIVGDVVGSWEACDFTSHTHTQNSHYHTMALVGIGGGTSGGTAYSGGGAYGYRPQFNYTDAVTATNNVTGGKETRPHNISVNWIIKY